jgi:hypothetical protein
MVSMEVFVRSECSWSRRRSQQNMGRICKMYLSWRSVLPEHVVLGCTPSHRCHTIERSTIEIFRFPRTSPFPPDTRNLTALSVTLKKSCSAAFSWHLFFSLPHDLNYLVLYRLMIPYEHGNKIIPYHGCTVPLLFTSTCFNTNTFVIHQQLRYYSTSTILPII